MLDPGNFASSSTSVPAPTRDISRDISRSAGVASSAGNGMTDGYGDNQDSNRTLASGVDFFSDLGTEHKRKDPSENRPDPSKLVIDRRELNTQLVEGRPLEDYEVKEKKVVPGGPGHQWRMMKLKRLYEQAEEQYVHLFLVESPAHRSQGSRSGGRSDGAIWKYDGLQ
jgi:hypothetical protein